MLNALRITPCWTMPGKVQAMVPSAAKLAATAVTVVATASGVAGWGVSNRSRSSVNCAVSRSTGAPFTPLPPMSMPSRIVT